MKNISKATVIGYLLSTLGVLLYAISYNIFIVSSGIYSGGIIGAIQISINLLSLSNINIDTNLIGIIYFILNVPLLFLLVKLVNKNYFIRAIYTMIMQTIFLSIIPVSETCIVSDILTATIIGGILGGVGSGLVLYSGSNAGGSDIIALYFAKKKAENSVGKVSIYINFVIFGLCLFFYNIEIVIYSIIYTVIFALAIDRMHIQNVKTTAMIFTKKPTLSKDIMQGINRGCSEWEGLGSYTKENTKIIMVVLSKYEKRQLKKIISQIDPKAFIIFNQNCEIYGNFEKRIF